MKKVLVVSVAALVLAMAFAGTAEAKCGVGCLNRKVKKLSSGLAKAQQTITSQSKTIAQQGQAIASLSQTVSSQGSAIAGQEQAVAKATSQLGCIAEVPVSEYGEPGGAYGYVWDTGTETFDTTALDVPYPGEGVGAWFLIDKCNGAKTATVSGAGSAFAQQGGLRNLLQPQVRQP